MNFYIQQNICINLLRIDAITNSSVLQIGSAGVIRPTAHLYNTGGFTGPAPEPIHPGGTIVTTQDSAEPTGSDTGSYIDSPAVPLSIS